MKNAKDIRLKKKYIIMLVISFIFIFSVKKSNAAELTIKAANTTINAGASTTLTISSDYVGRVNLSVSGGTLSKDKVWLENNSDTVTVTANTTGKIDITATPPATQMSKSDGSKVTVNPVSTSITVKEDTTNNKTDTTKNKTDTTNKTNTTPTTPNEPTFKSTKDTVYATGSINIRKSYSADSDAIGKLAVGESAIRTGIGDNGWSKVTYNGVTGYVKTNLITTQEPKKSSDKALKTLEVSPEGIDPEFNAETTTYTLVVGADIEKLDIKATANDEKSKIDITGNEELKIGDNIVKVTVTAEDGTTRIYNITVKKQEKAQLKLSSLKVNGYAISPTFSPDVYNYKVNIIDPNVNSLDVTAVSTDENAKVNISGNTSLKDGENTITITVESQDGKEQTTYQVTVNKAVPAITNKKNEKLLYIGIGAVALIAIIIIIVVVKKIKSKNKNIENKEQNNMQSINNSYEDLYGTYKDDNNIQNLPNDNKIDYDEEKYMNNLLEKSKSTINPVENGIDEIKKENEEENRAEEEKENEDEDYDLDDNYKMNRKGRHSK